MLDRWLLPLSVTMPIQAGVDGGPWRQVFLSLLLMLWYRKCWPAFLRWPGMNLKTVRRVLSLRARHETGIVTLNLLAGLVVQATHAPGAPRLYRPMNTIAHLSASLSTQELSCCCPWRVASRLVPALLWSESPASLAARSAAASAICLSCLDEAPPGSRVCLGPCVASCGASSSERPAGSSDTVDTSEVTLLGGNGRMLVLRAPIFVIGLQQAQSGTKGMARQNIWCAGSPETMTHQLGGSQSIPMPVPQPCGAAQRPKSTPAESSARHIPGQDQAGVALL